MAGKTRLPKLALSAEQLSELQQLSQSRTASLREVQRARMLCRYHEGETITGIARAMEITRKSVRKWIDKALAMGAEAALKEAYQRPRAPVITEEARAWVVHLACSKPKELGYAAELWTRSLLARHVRPKLSAAAPFHRASANPPARHRSGNPEMDLAPTRFRARERVASVLQRTLWSRSTGNRAQRESVSAVEGRSD